MSVNGILRAYEQRKALQRTTNAKGNIAPAPVAYDPLQDPDSTEFFIATIQRLEENEVHVARSNEPKSIHSPTQAPRLRFAKPIPKGTGPQKRFSINGWN